MRVFADLHIHSKYALATSRDTDLEHLAQGAKAKGLGLLSSGDFTHPDWFRELKSKLEPVEGSGLFSYQGVLWVLGGEVATVYEQDGRVRKVHHLIFAPDFESAKQVADALEPWGRLRSDGRPVLKGLDSAQLVELVTGVSQQVFVVPAHAWTPWFSVFGSKSGFDSIEECFKDQSKKIFAIETGLSSDPAMNWRLSKLDGLSLISNSDAHSPNPWRLGREANALDLRHASYRELFDAIRSKDPRRFLFTVEVDPSYGKYHFTGHRKCGVCLSPREAMEHGNICPKCGRKLTVGVLQRVEELADRPEGAVPPGAIPFKSLLPLYEVISFATGVNRLYSKVVTEEQSRLTRLFGNELAVLLDVPIDELTKTTDKRVAEAIAALRNGRVRFSPGFDGEYGRPSLYRAD